VSGGPNSLVNVDSTSANRRRNGDVVPMLIMQSTTSRLDFDVDTRIYTMVSTSCVHLDIDSIVTEAA